MGKSAQQYIAEFRRGEALKSTDFVGGLVVNGRIEKSALSLLTRELATGTPVVRTNIVELLYRVGLELDKPMPGKFSIIRDHAVMKTLLVEGFAKDDEASSNAESILRKKCRPADLAVFDEIYINSLRREKGEYLYLIAKAKSSRAAPLVEALARSAVWQESEDYRQIIRITQAALGNAGIEAEFIAAAVKAERDAPPAPKNRFYDVGTARDGKQVAVQLELLGLIGTPRTLLQVCRFLRSPLKTYVPNIKERSIRYDALDALRYNFPDEKVLSHPVSAVEWRAAEQFCVANLGATFDGETPELPPDQIYPTRVAPHMR